VNKLKLNLGKSKNNYTIKVKNRVYGSGGGGGKEGRDNELGERFSKRRSNSWWVKTKTRKEKKT